MICDKSPIHPSTLKFWLDFKIILTCGRCNADISLRSKMQLKTQQKRKGKKNLATMTLWPVASIIFNIQYSMFEWTGVETMAKITIENMLKRCQWSWEPIKVIQIPIKSNIFNWIAHSNWLWNKRMEWHRGKNHCAHLFFISWKLVCAPPYNVHKLHA